MRRIYSVIILFLVPLVIVLSACSKPAFKNFKYEGENTNWKASLNQYQTNDLDIILKYKGIEKLLGDIKFIYYLDNGYSAGGSITLTSDSKKFSLKSKVPVDESGNRQLKITKVTIKYNNKSEDITLKCDENN